MDLLWSDSADAVMLWWQSDELKQFQGLNGCGAQGDVHGFLSPALPLAAALNLQKHWAEALDLCWKQIKFYQCTMSGLSWLWYCPQTLLRRSKNIYMSMKSTKGFYWGLYPRYQVTFFSCYSINKSWGKTAYLKHLTGDFYSAVGAWHAYDNIPLTQWSNLHGTGSTGIVLDVHSAVAWVCPSIRALCIPLCFLTNELKRISTGEYLSEFFFLPPFTQR